jgi:hypothetical protein
MITVQTRKGKRICTHCRSRIVEAEKVGLTFEQAQPIIAEAAKTAKVGAGGKIDWKEIKKAINPIKPNPKPNTTEKLIGNPSGTCCFCGRIKSLSNRLNGKGLCSTCCRLIKKAKEYGKTPEQIKDEVAEYVNGSGTKRGHVFSWEKKIEAKLVTVSASKKKYQVNLATKSVSLPKRANNGFARTMADKIEISLRDYPIERAKYNSLDNETKGKIIKDLRDMLFDAMREGLV